MSHCKACDAPIKYGYISEETTGGIPDVVEDLCGRCIEKAHVNMHELYYDGLWSDKNCHPSHIVLQDEEDYLL